MKINTASSENILEPTMKKKLCWGPVEQPSAGQKSAWVHKWHSCSCSVALGLHGWRHARPPCPSPSPGVCPSSCPLHWWCHPAITFSVALFSFCPQSFPASGIFTKSHLFTSDDQNTGASALASVLPISIQGWFPLRLTGLSSLLTKGLSGVFSSTIVQSHQFFDTLPFLWSSSHN